MSYKDWYTINTTDSGYMCVATDKDGDFIKQYAVTTEVGSTRLGNCDCIAGHTWCRHKKMVVIFNQQKRMNSRWYYNFDREKWRAPPKESEA